MIKGIILYEREDYEKNQWFANRFIEEGPKHGLELQLILTDQLALGSEGGRLFIQQGKEKWESAPDFAINRSRNSRLALQLEWMGCKVFNSSAVTDICNDKAKTHQLINAHGIRSVKTLYGLSDWENHGMEYPLIVKTLAGHGGSEVHKVDNKEQLTEYVDQYGVEQILIQEMCLNPGTDIRAFCMGGEIVACVKRQSTESFKSNYSLGGRADAYSLSSKERRLVMSILSIMKFDFVGIDFLIDEKGELLFNEIEDAVGTRTLYQNYDIDIVQKYLGYLRNNLVT
ncbi:ATP-grasp domain-containing protein [Gracilibacillus sp. Marseille-QA3620]